MKTHFLRVLLSITLLGFLLSGGAYAKKKESALPQAQKKFRLHNEKILHVVWTRALKAGSPRRRYRPEISAPTVVGDVAYVGSQSKNFYAIVADTGKTLWRFKNEEPIATPAAVDGGKVFFSDLGGFMNCLDATTGERLWQQSFDQNILNKPLAAQGKIYFLKGERDVVALSQDDGRIIWQHTIKTYIRHLTMHGTSSFVADGARLYLGLADGQVYALNAANGSVLWHQDLAVPLESFKDIDARVVIDGDALYVGGYSEAFYKLNKVTGAVLWHTDVATAVNPVLVADRVVVSDTRGRLVGLDPKSGKQIWFHELNKSVLSAPVVFDDKIFVTSFDKKAFVVDPKTGNQLQELNGVSSINEPVVTSDHILVFNNDGGLLNLAVHAH